MCVWFVCFRSAVFLTFGHSEQTASTYAEAFNALLAQYEQVFKDKTPLQQVLSLIYTDIMEFHRSAMKYFRGPGEQIP